MTEAPQNIVDLLRQDKRYKVEAYDFVFEALRFGHDALGMGAAGSPEGEGTPAADESTHGESTHGESTHDESPHAESPHGEAAESESPERHLTPQQLCEAIRLYAIEQYGQMARCVLESWGVRATGDFGEIVFNLIRIGEMRKTDRDRREDFDNVFDFQSDLQAQFILNPPR
jgi:uncharacterized repeat protein (TIGR04138 family)